MAKKKNVGFVTAVNGSVIEAEFSKQLPAIYNELKIGGLTAEVQGYIDEKTVRALAMGSTKGIARQTEVVDEGHQIEVPVGDKVLGRMFNIFGQPIDNGEPLKAEIKRPIHAEPIPLENRQTSSEIFISGIKAIDLLAPMERAARSAIRPNRG